MAWADPLDTHNPTTGNAIPASWGDAVNAAIQWLAGDATNPKPSCRVYNSGNIAVADSSNVALTFDSERWDNGGMHSTASNTSRITVPSGGDGKYLINGGFIFAANATGNRVCGIRLNGTTFIATHGPSVVAGGNVEYLHISTVYALAAADYVELIAAQTSGGALNVTASGNFSPEFGAMWLAL